MKEVGFPPGVVNIVPGFGITAGSALSLHMDIDKISFTGSTEVGKIIKQNAGKSNLKKVSLELGGKSPLVVFDDVNLDEVVPMAVFSCYFNQGQCCCAGTRTFVQESIHDEFIKRAKEFVKTIVIGDPLENENTFHGPQIELKHQNRILEMIESGKKEGAKLEIGGEKHGNKGYFVKPTIFSGVKDEMRIAKEEIFGPVMQILTFKTLDEVIQRSNATNYGLAAGIFTQNIHTINTYVQNVQAGVVWVNCYLAGGTQAPFGGYKMSGNGRENGEDGIYEFCEIKSVTVKVPQKNS